MSDNTLEDLPEVNPIPPIPPIVRTDAPDGPPPIGTQSQQFSEDIPPVNSVSIGKTFKEGNSDN